MTKSARGTDNVTSGDKEKKSGSAAPTPNSSHDLAKQTTSIRFAAVKWNNLPLFVTCTYKLYKLNFEIIHK